MRHVLNAEQFTPDYLEIVFGHAEELHAKSIASRESRTRLLGLQAGMMLATLFYEPSTRTRMSFESAGHRLGMQVIGTENAEAFSSAAKGETLEDSVRVIGGFADIIVLRHKENGEDIKQYCANKGISFVETDSMYDALKKADVVYQTRVQRERHGGASTSRGQHPDFIIDAQALKILPEHSIVMHPLPRVTEIDPTVDYDPRAAYFRQSDNGVFVRMALLDQIAVANTIQ